MVQLEDIQRKPYRWIAAVASNWSIIALSLTAAYLADHFLGYLIAAILIGTRQHALGLLAHDGVHGLICKNRNVNDLLNGLLCWWPLLTSNSKWRQFHISHHRHLGTANDPELIGKRAVPHRWQMPNKRFHFLRQFIIDLSGRGALDIIRMRKRVPKFQNEILDRIGLPLFHFAFIAVSVLTKNYWLPVIWYGTFFSLTTSCIHLRLWTEHMGDETRTNRVEASWWQRFLFLPHNADCHFEHHKYPAVPFYNLRKIRTRDHSEPIVKLAEFFESFNRCSKVTVKER